jgi:putative tryptophan/tyrosine transport system substrate-binding protein
MWRKTVWLIATLTLSILIAPVAGREGWARNPGKLYRVGMVLVHPPNLLPPNVPQPSFGRGGFARAFLDRLADHGYIQEKNLVIEARYGGYERLAELAAELVRLPVDVIYVGGTKAVRIVSAAVKETPLVILSCDPFEHVDRLARPGGNLTGVTCMTTELSPKRLELLKEAVPNAVRVVFLSDPDDDPGGLKLTQDAAPRLGIKLHVTDVQAADRLQTWGESDLRTALSAAAKEHPDALFVYPDPILIAQGKQVAEFAVTNRLPTMFAFRESVDAGGLMSYGASLNAMGASAAELIAKILDGKRPSELPVEQATRFELVINLKTARALGLTIPPSLLARADQVIE